jgi:DNA-binding NarL/FixJ family response regulator
VKGYARTPAALRALLARDTSEPTRLLRLDLLSSGVTIVAEADLASAPAAIATGDVEVCVLVCGRPESIGESVRALTAVPGCPPVVVVVQTARVAQLVEAIAAGAHGYLLASMPMRQMARALGHAAQGRTALPRSVIGAAADQLRRDADPGLAGVSTAFTPRERQTLTMLRAGFSTREIADRLGVSTATIRTYVSAIVHKLGARDRAEVLEGFASDAPETSRFLHAHPGLRAAVPSPTVPEREVSPSS